jgi:hypothetical protein
LFLVGGCAVLTESQVAEVKRFAKASEGYSQLPGSMVIAYRSLQTQRDLMRLASIDFAKKDSEGNPDPKLAADAWTSLIEAYERDQTAKSTAAQMDDALSVLSDYSDLLSSLVSDQFSEDLGKSAVTLGKELDEAAKAYNEKWPQATKLPAIGGLIGGLVRGAGGIYIRSQQAKILRDSIKEAQPLVDALLGEVSSLAARMKDDFANMESQHLRARFEAMAMGSGHLGLGSLQRSYDNIAAARAGQTLSSRVGAAADTYRKAHERLVEETRTRKTLAGLIEQVETLQKEVKAAQKIRKEIEK